MSTAISAAVWEHSTAKATGLLVLLSLADQANDEGWCWPSVETIAKRCRISVRTVQRFLFELERLGEVEREERPGTSTRYRILVRGDNLAPRQSVRGDNAVTGGVTTVSPRNVSEPSLTTETSLRSVSAARVEPRSPTKLGARLDADWMPSPELIEQMRGERGDLDLKAEHLKFVDYWIAKPGKDGRKLDWPATWRNWMRNARPSANGHTRPRRHQETQDWLQRSMEWALEADAQKELET